MNQYIYPAIFFKDEDKFGAIFPDLDLCAEGKNLTEAYVMAKDMLKYDMDFNLPSTLQKIQEQAKKDEIVMYIDTIIDPKKIKKA